jgi:hypothetical protein
MNPMVGTFPAGCARPARGHAAAAPPIRVTKSRRLIASPKAQDRALHDLRLARGSGLRHRPVGWSVDVSVGSRLRLPTTSESLPLIPPTTDIKRILREVRHGVIQRHAEPTGRCLLLPPNSRHWMRRSHPVICQHAPWWIFRVRGSVTPLPGMMDHGTATGLLAPRKISDSYCYWGGCSL